MGKIYDCIIIGAGPAGLFAGYKLASQNFSVLIIDSQKSIQRKICGEYLCPQGVEILKKENFFDIINKFEPLIGMKIFSPDGKEIVTRFPHKNNVQNGLSLNREVFDKELYTKALQANAEIHFDEKFKSAELKNNFVSVSTSKQNYTARYLIGADGRQSRVAKNFNLGVTLPEKRVAVHTYFKPKRVQERFGQMHIFEGGCYVGIDPISDIEVNFSLVCDSSLVKSQKDLLFFLNSYIEKSSFLSRELGPIDAGTKVWTVYPIQHQVTSVGGPLCALIGDAAGFLDPLTGEGVYNALLSANILAEEFVKSRNKNIFNYNGITKLYSERRNKIMNEKTALNKIFQKMIRAPKTLEIVANFLSKKSKRADAFVGIIGNIYKPYEGILKMFF